MCLDIFKEQNKAELENLTELLAVVYLGIRLIISMENCDELRTVGFFFLKKEICSWRLQLIEVSKSFKQHRLI